ncbi:SDR family oxidoreductase [Erythrobacter ani]|uniref:SDR family oxidoreductase n=1 Tax=Erythrobacter ani TaxID=2827235 RepID=UPI00210803E8|nr:SDR family oxidoreductase [Erythrobacter ani]
MAGTLEGKVAFVAGGSSGINLGVAHGFAEQGAKVALISRSEERISAAAVELTDRGFDAIGMAADVRDYAAVERTLAQTAEKWGPIDIVLSGAAGNFLCDAKDLSANGFKTVVDIDLLGTFNVFRASYDHVRKPGASLIAVTAGQGDRQMKQQIHACAAKAGVNMVTRCLALEWGNKGIRVNGISPGPIANTEGVKRLTTPEDREVDHSRFIPLGRFGEKREIADLAVFLSSRGAKYITGAIVECDGGTGLT